MGKNHRRSIDHIPIAALIAPIRLLEISSKCIPLGVVHAPRGSDCCLSHITKHQRGFAGSMLQALPLLRSQSPLQHFDQHVSHTPCQQYRFSQESSSAPRAATLFWKSVVASLLLSAFMPELSMESLRSPRCYSFAWHC